MVYIFEPTGENREVKETEWRVHFQEGVILCGPTSEKYPIYKVYVCKENPMGPILEAWNDRFMGIDFVEAIRQAVKIYESK